MSKVVIEFKFGCGQKVKTVLGDVGIIQTIAKNASDIQYFVSMKEGRGSWYLEDQITEDNS